jgi:hypothetical protein
MDLFHPGSGIRDGKIRIRDGKIRIRDKHPGSATLVPVMRRETNEMIGLRISSQAQHQDGEPGSQYV